MHQGKVYIRGMALIVRHKAGYMRDVCLTSNEKSGKRFDRFATVVRVRPICTPCELFADCAIHFCLQTLATLGIQLQSLFALLAQPVVRLKKLERLCLQ